VGDEVLQQVAARIRDTMRAGDVVARYGGDEFIVIVQDVADATEVTELARRVVRAVNQPIEVAGESVLVGASVGIALSLDGPEDPIRLLARADSAMYRAKDNSGSSIEIFDAALQKDVEFRTDIEAALATALSNRGGGGLRLEYQPIYDARSLELAGLEALIRWDRPGHGLLAPDAFIPIAETSGLIIDLDCWVLEHATAQLVEWAEVTGLSHVPLAVNISGRHLLSGRLPAHLRAVLAETGLDPGRLTVEITETVLLKDLVVAGGELDAVRALGVKVAIDDFGTGYTSLAHLQRLPMDIIKIDRSFVSQLGEQRGRALVRMVTVFGHSMDIAVVAEGVETRAELAELQAMHADQLQGFLLSRPLMPRAVAAAAADLLEMA
jgi:predicted signal transduction protein with EAL and GGDEF domain